jgi:molybdenum cofactor guanylyltransferase
MVWPNPGGRLRRQYRSKKPKDNSIRRMFDVEAFILVGGTSSRMGKDKSQLRFGDRTSVQIIGGELQSVARSVVTVGAQAPLDGNLLNIPDSRLNWGPLAGIHAALGHAQSEFCLIVACDFPFVNSKLFERLLDCMNESDAVVPIQRDRRVQPLCSVYRRSPCVAAAAKAIAAGEHSPRALLDRIRVRYISFNEISDLEGAEYFFYNVNTPDNYERAKQIFQSQR